MAMQRHDESERHTRVGFIRTVTRPGAEYDRNEIVAAVARHLGFARVRGSVAAPVRSAINAAIRRGVLARESTRIVRIA